MPRAIPFSSGNTVTRYINAKQRHEHNNTRPAESGPNPTRGAWGTHPNNESMLCCFGVRAKEDVPAGKEVDAAVHQPNTTASSRAQEGRRSGAESTALAEAVAPAAQNVLGGSVAPSRTPDGPDTSAALVDARKTIAALRARLRELEERQSPLADLTTFPTSPTPRTGWLCAQKPSEGSGCNVHAEREHVSTHSPQLTHARAGPKAGPPCVYAMHDGVLVCSRGGETCAAHSGGSWMGGP